MWGRQASTRSWSDAFNDISKRATTSLQQLGEEEVVAPTDAHPSSIASSSVASSAHNPHVIHVQHHQRQQHQNNSNTRRRPSHNSHDNHNRRHKLPSLREDSVSVLTYDPKQEQSLEERLAETEDKLLEMQHMHKAQSESLRDSQTEYTVLSLEFQQERRDWGCTLEELQSQKVITQERLDILEDDLANGPLMEELAALITEDAPHFSDDSSGSDDDGKSVVSHASNLSRRLRFGQHQSKRRINNNKAHQNKVSVLTEYISKLQAKLAEAMHGMQALSNQISQLEESQIQELDKIKLKLRDSYQTRAQQELDAAEEVLKVKSDSREEKQALEAKLERTTEKMMRLQELVEELREMATTNSSNNKEAFEGTLALHNLTQQFDDLAKEKDAMVQKHYDEREDLELELKRLQKMNDKHLRTIERLRAGDELAALERDLLPGGDELAGLERAILSSSNGQNDDGGEQHQQLLSTEERGGGEDYDDDDDDDEDDTSDEDDEDDDDCNAVEDDDYQAARNGHQDRMIPLKSSEVLSVSTDEDGEWLAARERHKTSSSATRSRGSRSSSASSHSSSHSSSHHTSGSSDHSASTSSSNHRSTASSSRNESGSAYSRARQYVASRENSKSPPSRRRTPRRSDRSVSPHRSPSRTRTRATNRFSTHHSTSMSSSDGGDSSCVDDVSIDSDDKSLHVEQHRRVDKAATKRLSMHLQESQYSQMDDKSIQKSQKVLNRFL